jgi:hypothetical protein
MTRIVRTAYRYKRPPGKRKPVALEVPAVITAASKRRRVSDEAKAALAASIKLDPGELEPKPVIATSRTSSGAAAKSAIVTARRPRSTVSLPEGLLADTPEEANRRADAADALWRELVRRIREDR